ncbi:hypothetical protein D3C80_635390 [compost metagenome]
MEKSPRQRGGQCRRLAAQTGNQHQQLAQAGCRSRAPASGVPGAGQGGAQCRVQSQRHGANRRGTGEPAQRIWYGGGRYHAGRGTDQGQRGFSGDHSRHRNQVRHRQHPAGNGHRPRHRADLKRYWHGQHPGGRPGESIGRWRHGVDRSAEVRPGGRKVCGRAGRVGHRHGEDDSGDAEQRQDHRPQKNGTGPGVSCPAGPARQLRGGRHGQVVSGTVGADGQQRHHRSGGGDPAGRHAAGADQERRQRR